MKYRIYNYLTDNDFLRQVSEEVDLSDSSIPELIQLLKNILKENIDARGISAVQIGVLKRICICKWGEKELVIINPKITRVRGSQIFKEGCLSLPFIAAPIERYQKVWCTYLDENFQEQEVADGGRMSNIIQHEIDHMNGISHLADIYQAHYIDKKGD